MRFAYCPNYPTCKEEIHSIAQKSFCYYASSYQVILQSMIGKICTESNISFPPKKNDLIKAKRKTWKDTA